MSSKKSLLLIAALGLRVLRMPDPMRMPFCRLTSFPVAAPATGRMVGLRRGQFPVGAQPSQLRFSQRV